MAVTYTGSVTIADGQTVSAAVDLGNTGAILVGLDIPAGYTPGDITFQRSPDGGTYSQVVKEDGTVLTLTAPPAGKAVAVSPQTSASFRFMKVVVSNAPSGAKTLTYHARA